MKKWEILFTYDKATFTTDVVEGTTYTGALLNAMLKYPEAEIVGLAEVTYA